MFISVLFLSFSLRFVVGQNQIAQINALCFGQSNCVNCINAHYRCNWCYQEDFVGPRCITNVSTCNPQKLRPNQESSAKNIENRRFTDVEDIDNVVQLRPQVINLNLRKDDAINITFEYRPAKNFPLELYYLMDLTISMKETLNTMTTLGEQMAKKMEGLTKNFKIGFGSYVDKTEMPFYPTDYHARVEKNPCGSAQEKCEEGYLFRHRLNFTNNITEFITKLKQSQISGNVDNLEGGLDALMQTLICKEQMQWTDNSRKLVVFTTESPMHLAGDGLLAGAVARNSDKICLISPDGEYVKSSYYDYPSLEEIHHQLDERKINVIVASKEEALYYYNELHKMLKDSTYIGKLEDNSTNILDLIQDGYYDFLQRAKFSLNVGNLTGLEVDFFADCWGTGSFDKTDTCWNVKEGKRIKFILQIKSGQYHDVENATFYIEERTIKESITINAEFTENLCKQCDIVSAKGLRCVNGQEICGSCFCDSGWVGESCETQCDNIWDTCRPVDENNTKHISCYGQGDCVCGKCSCYFPYSGEFCDYRCPYNKITREICNGPSHGTCVEDKCLCDEAYSGDLCDCETSQENCKVPGNDTLCGRNGVCECNKCVCDDGYEGQFCQKCRDCEGLCNNYLLPVQNFINNKTTEFVQKNVVVTLEEVEELTVGEHEEQCYYRYDKSEDTYCEVKYTYRPEKKNVRLVVEQENCNTRMQAGVAISLIIFSILIAGLLPFLAWKLYVYRKDKLEYAKFTAEVQRGQMREMNPIYHSPITTYTNPIRDNK